MTTVAHALDGEPLDALVWRVIGGGPAAVEATLLLNPGIAAIGASLPAGHQVQLPDISAAPDEVPLVQLWD